MAKEAGSGGVEAATVGKGSSRTSLSIKGKEFRDPEGVWEGATKGGGEEMVTEGSLLPLPLHSPHFPIFPTPASVPVAHGGEEGERRWRAFNTRRPTGRATY